MTYFHSASAKKKIWFFSFGIIWVTSYKPNQAEEISLFIQSKMPVPKKTLTKDEDKTTEKKWMNEWMNVLIKCLWLRREKNRLHTNIQIFFYKHNNECWVV